MKVTIDQITVDESKLEAIATLKVDLRALDRIYDSHLAQTVERIVVEKLSEKLILERGSEILDSIPLQRLVSATLMRTAGKLSE